MKNIVILGAGTAGTMMLNKLSKALDPKEWKLTIVDKEEDHYYQPGFLFIPFGIYDREDVIKPKNKFFPKEAKVILSPIDRIDAGQNIVYLDNDQTLSYDYLIIATGTDICPEEIDGMNEELWHKSIFDFYTVEGAVALAEYLKDWTKELAQELAYHEDMGELTIRHWEVINYIRDEFEKNGDAPSIRKLTKESGVSTKELYQLFPKGPAKKAAKVAGLPKPKGCI